MASLELHGTVLIWLLIETQDHEAAATDYGQAVGGRVRLFRSGHVPLSAGQYDANATGEEKRKELLPLRTLCIGFSPAEARLLTAYYILLTAHYVLLTTYCL